MHRCGVTIGVIFPRLPDGEGLRSTDSDLQESGGTVVMNGRFGPCRGLGLADLGMLPYWQQDVGDVGLSDVNRGLQVGVKETKVKFAEE
jgi:hypothetical protein